MLLLVNSVALISGNLQVLLEAWKFPANVLHEAASKEGIGVELDPLVWLRLHFAYVL